MDERKIEQILIDMTEAIKNKTLDFYDPLKKTLDKELEKLDVKKVERIKGIALKAIEEYKTNPTEELYHQTYTAIRQTMILIGIRKIPKKEKYGNLSEEQLKKLLWQKLHEMWAAANRNDQNEMQKYRKEFEIIEKILYPGLEYRSKEYELFDRARNNIAGLFVSKLKESSKKEFLKIASELEEKLKEQGII